MGIEFGQSSIPQAYLRTSLTRDVSPEDPFGVGIEPAGNLGVEGNMETIRSVFFPADVSKKISTFSVQIENLTSLVRVFGLGSRMYTFCDLRFPYRTPWQKDPNPITIKDVLVIPIAYKDFKNGLENMGFVEEPKTRIFSEEVYQYEKTSETVYTTVIGSDFGKVAEKIIKRKLRVLTFPGTTGISYLMGEVTGSGEYVILCGEQVEGGERVTLVSFRKGILDIPKRE